MAEVELVPVEATMTCGVAAGVVAAVSRGSWEVTARAVNEEARPAERTEIASTTAIWRRSPDGRRGGGVGPVAPGDWSWVGVESIGAHSNAMGRGVVGGSSRGGSMAAHSNETAGRESADGCGAGASGQSNPKVGSVVGSSGWSGWRSSIGSTALDSGSFGDVLNSWFMAGTPSVLACCRR